ncbi:MAG: DUF3429 domain-containing protein [Burkholderiaceae bacterium]
MSVSTPHPPSPVALGLGYLAVLPFVVGALLVWVAGAGWHATVSQALSAYAAVVISFIGAIHWGFAFPQSTPAPRLFVWGVVPSLVAWVAVLQAPRIGLLIHAAMLVTCYLVDRVAYPRQDAAAWLPLRLRLTLFATVSCLVGAAGS